MKNIIFGISGKVLTDHEIELIETTKPHGVILFSRNCENKIQIKKLTNHIKSIHPETKIFIDQEGGRVQRIKPPIIDTKYPNMEYFGNIYDEDKSAGLKAVEENFYHLMHELKDLGIDITCAPVCDLRFKDAHDVIGDRSFGYTVEKIVDLSKAALEGIHKAGGEGVIKHIPGHGRAFADSHKELPHIDTSLEELEQTDFAVFKALANSCPYAMTAHVVYTALDSELPATLSPTVIKYIREEIGFAGMIMTDALEMEALSGTAMKDRAVASIKAGCDIALYCTSAMGEVKNIFLALEEMTNISSA
jgi:beta-glucosidase-like glycosyl hydrolase